MHTLPFKMFLIFCACLTAVAFGEQASNHYFGVNIAGGDFGKGGTVNADYRYPFTWELDYFKKKELLLIRVPLLWPRLQRKLFGDLSASDLKVLDTVIAQAAQRNMLILLDAHDYLRYNDKIIGSPEVPRAAFGNFWRKMADHFKGMPAIWAYGLSNEPHDLGKYSLFDAAQTAIDSIRTVDKKHIIMVGGDSWSSATNWPKVSDNLKNLSDPANNLMYEAHCYFDVNFSGSYSQSYDKQGATPMTGVDRVKPFVNWLEANNKRGLLGEYGVPGDDPKWLTVLDNFLNYLDEHNVCGTYWAAGPWPENPHWTTVEPCNGVDKPQIPTLCRHLGDNATLTQTATMEPAPKGQLDLSVMLDSRRSAFTVTGYIPRQSLVRIAVYDISGRCVRVLYDGWRASGSFSVVWEGECIFNPLSTSRIYLATIEADGIRTAKRMVGIF